jgi:hypothetical protein
VPLAQPVRLEPLVLRAQPVSLVLLAQLVPLVLLVQLAPPDRTAWTVWQAQLVQLDPRVQLASTGRPPHGP